MGGRTVAKFSNFSIKRFGSQPFALWCECNKPKTSRISNGWASGANGWASGANVMPGLRKQTMRKSSRSRNMQCCRAALRRGLASLPSSSKVAVTQPALSAATCPAASIDRSSSWSSWSSQPPWSIEDPHARYRKRIGHTVEVLRDSYPTFFSDLPNLEIYTPDSLPLPVESPDLARLRVHNLY